MTFTPNCRSVPLPETGINSQLIPTPEQLCLCLLGRTWAYKRRGYPEPVWRRNSTPAKIDTPRRPALVKLKIRAIKSECSTMIFVLGFRALLAMHINESINSIPPREWSVCFLFLFFCAWPFYLRCVHAWRGLSTLLCAGFPIDCRPEREFLCV